MALECVGWNETSTVNSTMEILLGTADGQIFETCIECTDEYFKREDRYCKMVYSHGSAIKGIEVNRFPGSKKLYCIISTKSKLLQCIGYATQAAPVFEGLFTDPHSIDMPEGIGTLFIPQKSSQNPKRISWMTGSGLYLGNLVFGSQGQGESIIENGQIVPFPFENVSHAAVTDFHYIFLSSNRVCAVCALSGSPVFDAKIENAKKLTCDFVEGTLWIHSPSLLNELVVNDEERDVWKMYMIKRQFDSALSYCKSKEQRQIVACHQGDYHFEQNRFTLAAQCYANSSKRLEEVVLKFLEKNERDALKEYLINKIDSMEGKVQLSCLAFWVVEIMLNMIDNADDQTAADLVKEDLYSILSVKKIRDNLDKEATFELFRKHFRMKELVYFAEIIGDYKSIIEYNLNEKEYKKALKVLQSWVIKYNSQGNAEAVYEHSPTLVEHLPSETVSLWLTMNLEPGNLVTSLLKLASEESNKKLAIAYVEKCEQSGMTDAVLNNFLLNLYASLKLESKIIDFLKREPLVDLDQALFTCKQNGLDQCLARIYDKLESFSLAVSACLKQEKIDKATEYAAKIIDESERRNCFLTIACNLIQRSRVTDALKLINSHNLKIQDLLPFIPDFPMLDEYKEEVCEALRTQKEHIESLKQQQEESTKSAELLKQDLQGLKKRYVVIKGSQKCSKCGYALLSRASVVFLCGHCFHYDCVGDPKDCSVCGLAAVDSIGVNLLFNLTEDEINAWRI